MAQAYPSSEFIGIDYHGPSIETATERAREAGVANVRFETADATSYEGGGYDLIAFFDCLHDMADPAGGGAPCQAGAGTRRALDDR
jgi:2-polyprenyl-3-methyl-5-hydroxy-6-metoxy-1,4-benzoquinol methylase